MKKLVMVRALLVIEQSGDDYCPPTTFVATDGTKVTVVEWSEKEMKVVAA